MKNLRKTVDRDQKKDSKRISALKSEQKEKEKQAYSESPYAIYQEAIDPQQAERYREYLQQYNEYRNQNREHKAMANINHYH